MLMKRLGVYEYLAIFPLGSIAVDFRGRAGLEQIEVGDAVVEKGVLVVVTTRTPLYCAWST
jgi:hypothetical protein